MFGEEAIERFKQTFSMGYTQAQGYGERHRIGTRTRGSSTRGVSSNFSGRGRGRGGGYHQPKREHHEYMKGHDDFYDRGVRDEEEYIGEQIAEVHDKIIAAIQIALRSRGRAYEGRLQPGGQPTRYVEAPYFTHVTEDDEDVPWDVLSPWADKFENKEADKPKDWITMIREECERLDLV